MAVLKSAPAGTVDSNWVQQHRLYNRGRVSNLDRLTNYYRAVSHQCGISPALAPLTQTRTLRAALGSCSGTGTAPAGFNLTHTGRRRAAVPRWLLCCGRPTPSRPPAPVYARVAGMRACWPSGRATILLMKHKVNTIYLLVTLRLASASCCMSCLIRLSCSST